MSDILETKAEESVSPDDLEEAVTNVTVSSGQSVTSIDDSGNWLEGRTVDDSIFDPSRMGNCSMQTIKAADRKAVRSPMRIGLEIAKLLLVPLLTLASFICGIGILGLTQRLGWLTSTGELSQVHDVSQVGDASSEADAMFICPMMCVPPTSQPGRCPVCGMELVKAAAGASSEPSHKIQIDARSRRVAGIDTVEARRQGLTHEIRGVGEIRYDESKLKTLSAYIDGRIEELFANYTGKEVSNGETLALLYSPDLYSAQVEYLKTLDNATAGSVPSERLARANDRLLKSSHQRLVEMGLTPSQIKQLEHSKMAERRVEIKAPISGTVIEKMAVTGQYVKAGEPIYQLADLSTVWLVLGLYPQDAAMIHVGQEVIGTSQSTGVETFRGTVEFIEPYVDPKLRTVGVRVVIPNPDGFLKPGDFARATIHAPLASNDSKPIDAVVIPRNSLLATGDTSLAYVETKPGEFELRHLKTGPTSDGMVAVFEGINAGEQVVSRSTFLLDAQMQLQGNPSLIDPNKAVEKVASESSLTSAEQEEIQLAMGPLSAEDRLLAEDQEICPVTKLPLGSKRMGTPIKIEIDGRSVFICCEGCRRRLMADPGKYFKILDVYLAGKPDTSLNKAGSQSLPESELSD